MSETREEMAARLEALSAFFGDSPVTTSSFRIANQAALRAGAEALRGPGWQDIRTALPKAGKPVLGLVQTPKPCVLLVMWCPSKTLEAHPDCEGGDYDEEKDEYFASEGWYQCYAVNGSLDDEPFWKLHDAVSHWQPLPSPPVAEPVI